MVSKITIENDENPDASDIQAVVDELIAFNTAQAGDNNRLPLTLFARDETNKVVGGLIAATSWNLLYIDILVLMKDHRNMGIGKLMLKKAEQEAIKRGCRLSSLFTYSFQAREFYERNGYTVFGVLDDCPPGYRRYYMKKELMAM